MVDLTLATDATIPVDEGIDITVNESTSADASVDTFTQVYQSPNVQCHQGYTTDGTYHYTFDTTHLYKWDDTWTLVTENSNPLTNLPSDVNHLGDGYYYAPDDELHTPAEYWNGSSDYGSVNIAVYDASDLSYKTHYGISNGAAEGSGVWIDEANGFAWISNYVNSTTPLYKYNLSDYSYTSESFSPSSGVNRVQSLYRRNGFWYLPSNDSNSTHVVDASSGSTVQQIAAHSGGAYEGVDYSEGSFRVLHDPDGNSTGTVYFHNQDVTATTSVTQSVADGQNTYTLSGFDGAGGNFVWVDISLSSTDGNDTPVLNSATVTAPSGATVMVWDGASWVEAPVKYWDGSSWTQASAVKTADSNLNW